MTPEEQMMETSKQLETASQMVQKLVQGKGKGAVLIAYIDEKDFQFNFAWVRISKIEGLKLFETAKQEIINKMEKTPEAKKK